MGKPAIRRGKAVSDSVNWMNPYRSQRGRWYRGNLHTHTSQASGCAQMAMGDALDMYARTGYDFLSISDHMTLSRPRDARLMLIPGIEWNSVRGEHTGLYGFDPRFLRAATKIEDQELLLKAVRGKSLLTVLNHPNWQLIPHYRREQLDARPGASGVEIYNGVIERLAGAALATDKWDYLLTRGRRLLGLATDDAHVESDIARAWIVVRAPERSARSILKAILEGNFYCSTGVVLNTIRREGDRIRMESDNADEIWVVVDGGQVIARVRDRAISFNCATLGTTYVRFEAYGSGSAMAWTQPFFMGEPGGDA